MFGRGFACAVLFCVISYVTCRCDKEYSNVDPKHTMCSSRSSNYIDGGISEETKKEIVDLHNELRQEVAESYKAANMQKMVWDDEIAQVAQRMAEKCTFAHDSSTQRAMPGKYGTGQNLALGWSTWTQSIRAWFDEIKDFKYGRESTPFQKIAHFTQLVWSDSVRLGCGFANCKNAKNLYVCNYGPVGNIRPITKPWVTGRSACSKCPDTCNDGLCDCGGKVCYNGGKLGVNKCQCQCKDKSHDPENCTLDCSKTKDKFYCKFWGSYECGLYSNAPADCPHLCKVCP